MTGTAITAAPAKKGKAEKVLKSGLCCHPKVGAKAFVISGAKYAQVNARNRSATGERSFVSFLLPVMSRSFYHRFF
jgi:hypothetical protein